MPFFRTFCWLVGMWLNFIYSLFSFDGIIRQKDFHFPLFPVSHNFRLVFISFDSIAFLFYHKFHYFRFWSQPKKKNWWKKLMKKASAWKFDWIKFSLWKRKSFAKKTGVGKNLIEFWTPKNVSSIQKVRCRSIKAQELSNRVCVQSSERKSDGEYVCAHHVP